MQQVKTSTLKKVNLQKINQMNDLLKKKEAWGPWATVGFTILLAIIITVVQIAVVIVYLAVLKVLDPSLELRDMGRGLVNNGLFLSVVIIISFPVDVGLILLFCRLRRGIRIRDYLAFQRVKAKPVLLCIGATLTVMLLLDGLSIIIKHPVPEFMISVYQSAGSLPLLWITICVLAPISEELFFRGFFYKGLSRSRLGVAGAIVVTSLCWAIIHVQYDAFIIATIFVYGLALGTARAKTRSVIPAILMHVTINIVSTIQTAIIVHG